MVGYDRRSGVLSGLEACLLACWASGRLRLGLLLLRFADCDHVVVEGDMPQRHRGIFGSFQLFGRHRSDLLYQLERTLVRLPIPLPYFVSRELGDQGLFSFRSIRVSRRLGWGRLELLLLVVGGLPQRLENDSRLGVNLALELLWSVSRRLT